MSITQSRMIALINAANAFRAAFHDINARLEALDQSLDSGHITPEAAFRAIYQYVGPKRVANYDDASATIETEARHFHRNRNRNERVRLAQERKRRAAGVSPREYINPLAQITPPTLTQRVIPALAPDITTVATQFDREMNESIIKYQPEIARELGLLPSVNRAADWTPDDPEDTFDTGGIIEQSKNVHSDISAKPVDNAGSTVFDSKGYEIPRDRGGLAGDDDNKDQD